MMALKCMTEARDFTHEDAPAVSRQRTIKENRTRASTCTAFRTAVTVTLCVLNAKKRYRQRNDKRAVTDTVTVTYC